MSQELSVSELIVSGSNNSDKLASPAMTTSHASPKYDQSPQPTRRACLRPLNLSPISSEFAPLPPAQSLRPRVLSPRRPAQPKDKLTGSGFRPGIIRSSRLITESPTRGRQDQRLSGTDDSNERPAKRHKDSVGSSQDSTAGQASINHSPKVDTESDAKGETNIKHDRKRYPALADMSKGLTVPSPGSIVGVTTSKLTTPIEPASWIPFSAAAISRQEVYDSTFEHCNRRPSVLDLIAVSERRSRRRSRRNYLQDDLPRFPWDRLGFISYDEIDSWETGDR